MKRYVCLMIIAAALFVGCGKKVDPTANNKVGIMNETVRDIDPTRVEISGTYSYLTNLDAIYVLVGTGNDMSGAMAFESVLSGKSFTADVTGLKENTNYYYRYRFVSMGTEQESEAVKSFTTATYGVPVVITAEVTNIMAATATCGGEVTDDGYLDVTARGVCWGTTQNPTANDSHTSDGTGTGVFTSATTNLELGTKYYIRAYATNAKGTGYGEVREFTTLDGDSDIYTGAISGITACSAVCDGSKVTDGGGLDVMDKGLCWAKHPNPTTADAKVSKGAGLGEFAVEMTGLEVGERYYVRAYSVNTKETKYGNEREFTTMNGIPAVTTSSVTNITATTATCGGEVTDDGGFPVTERGVCWSKSTNPTVEGSHKTGGSGNGSFTVGIDNLEMDETYHVRAYAKNSHTTSYGDDVVFSTKDGIPAVTTSSVTNITATTATCGGEVTDDGGFAVTERGVCWSTSQNPTVADSHTTDGGGTGSFTSKLTELAGNTTYYVRAYATNSHSTSYGEQKSFTVRWRFSVSPSTTVEFAPGNLYWDGSAFRFEANQWSSASAWNASHVSHFKWSDAANAVTGNDSHSGDLFCASNFTVAGDSHTDWRTLSEDEWEYLLGTGSSYRTNAASLRAWVTLTDVSVSGLVILPDGSTVTASSVTTTTAVASSGAVFLPAAGYRNGAVVINVGSRGYYWSGTPIGDYEEDAYGMRFSSGGVYVSIDLRKGGYSVRLVR